MKKRLILTIGERYNIYDKGKDNNSYLWLGSWRYMGKGKFSNNDDTTDEMKLPAFKYVVPRYISVHSSNIENYNIDNVEIIDIKGITIDVV